LESILWEQRIPDRPEAVPGLDILRTKGYFKLEDGREYVVQGVTDIFEMKQVSEARRDRDEGEEMAGKLVFIGRGVRSELIDAFNKFVGI
jgi:G3E family GTPase